VPVHALHTIKAGTTSKVVLVYARPTAGEGPGVAGLGHDLPGAAGAYVREGEDVAHAVTLRPGTVGRWDSGGFVEVEPNLLPGVYQFGVPDDLLAQGSPRALLLLTFPEAVIDPIEVDLVAYDPQDEACIGMAQLQDHKRHAFLRRALPRMTEQELELGKAAERDLRETLATRREPGAGE
jgi:hypothetical protein